MNEVEKMYSNAHVYPRVYGDITKETFENKVFNMADMCNEAFTAEKQIELIKFITSLGACEIENWNDKGFHFAIKRERIYPTMFLSLSNIDLQETLADVINNLWQDLTEEERKQIKEILE